MKKLSIVFLIVLLVSMFLPPVYAEGKKGDVVTFAIGVPVVVDNNVDVRYTGKTWKDSEGNNKYEYIAQIQQAPIYNDDGSAVDCSWHGSEDAYIIINNVFSAQVIGAYITTTYQGQSMSWNPIVMVDSKEYTAKGSPKVLAVDPINANYKNNTLEWDYGVCVRRVRVIEGMIQETWIFDKDPKGTVWIKDNTQKSAGFTWAIAPYAYDANNNAIPINQYKQVSAKDMAAATYPVVIDPTEVYVTSASDGHIMPTAMTWANSWNQSSGTVTNLAVIDDIGSSYISSSNWYVMRAYLYFNTSALPDATTITAANISLYGRTDGSTTNFNISIQSGMPTYPHDPLVTGDFDKSFYGTAVGNAGFNTSGFTTSGYNNISMNSTGISWISLTGTTKLCLRSNKDISGTPPTGTSQEYVMVYSYEKGAGYRPYLEVTYSSSTAPTVTTNPATYVTGTTARLNGYLNADGGAACTVWFNYSLWNGSAWLGNVSTANQSGKVTGDSFYADLTGLNNSSTYRFIALADNGVGIGLGAWVNFSTVLTLQAPTNVLCSADSTSISLSWTKGGNASQTYIRYKIGAYPTSSTDGNAVANQSGVNFNHIGLDSGTSYYYRLWGLDGGTLSTTNVTTMCTTLAGSSVATPAPLPTVNFSGGDTTPNGSALTNNPLYTLGNQEAAAISVPQGTWWMLVGLGILLVTGLFIFTRSRNLLLSLGAMIIAGVVMANMGMFPIWIMWVFGLAGIGMSWKELR